MKKAQIAERQNKLKDYILNRPGEYISSSVSKHLFGVSDSTFRADFCEIAKELGGVVEAKAGAGLMFVPVEKAKDPEEQLKDAISQLPAEFGRNHEGYKDPTASKAVENIFNASEKERINEELATAILFGDGINKELNPLPGEVWEGECSNGFTDMLLIIKNFGMLCSCLKLKEVSSIAFAVISYMGNHYSTDARLLGTKPTKYIKKKLFELDEDTMSVILDDISDIYSTRTGKSEELELRERELEEREQELDEKADILRIKEENLNEAQAEIDERKAEIERTHTQRMAELDELEAKINEDLEHLANKIPLELVALRTKVEMYERFEKFIFGKGMPV